MPSAMRTSVRIAVMELTTNDKGAIAEAEIVAAATRIGIAVFRPVADGGRADLVFDAAGRLLRVQCKWARRVGDVVICQLSTNRRTAAGFLRTTYTRHEVAGSSPASSTPSKPLF